ncbi:MAG: type II toxin-antitoxin system VapC family toxin [Nanoarchaeota archaeon]
MYCLDTDVVIEFLRGDKKIFRKIKEVSKTQPLFITSLSLSELYKGAYLSSNPQKEIEKLKSLLYYLELITITEKTAEIFGKKYNELLHMGKMTQEFDLLNASIALSYDLVFVTRNRKHYANVPNLKLESW